MGAPFFVVDAVQGILQLAAVGASTPICNLNPGHQPEAATIENQVPVFGYLFGVIACGESVDALPEAGTFFDTNMRKQIENTTGKPLRVTIRRENGTFFAHLLLRPPVAARFRRLARKAGVSLEAALQLSIEQAARHFAA